MSDDPLGRIASHDRVSIRAVLARNGEDPSAALARAGIIDAVALPVVVGEDADLPGGILGDGITPNVTAVLETEAQEGFESSAGGGAAPAQPALDAARPFGLVTATLPAAYGMRSFAPVRKIGG
jgi:hypothetical protein